MKGPQDILYAEHVPLSAVNIHREVMFSLPCHEVVLSRHGLAISTGKQLENRRETSVRKGVDGTQQTLEVINDFFFFYDKNQVSCSCLVLIYRMYFTIYLYGSSVVLLLNFSMHLPVSHGEIFRTSP